jgi:hypothetical protein
VTIAGAAESHPNATVALVTTGPVTLVVWMIDQYTPSIPNEVAAAAAGIVISTVLLFGRYVRVAASAVARYGVVGCWHRLLHGDGS